jgi:UDP-N-acetylmuramoyl-L-alanyl-D-glutamate--2,6-diaminopimelate ligase
VDWIVAWPPHRVVSKSCGRTPFVVVDYAHTPDALYRTMETARTLAPGSRRVHVVLGAGGNRDRDKRPEMGRAASAADVVWLTADNPRDEDPAAIADQMRTGLTGHPSVHTELDRHRAIQRAIALAHEDDVVLIAGKGHETTQEIRGEVRPFADADAARSAPR